MLARVLDVVAAGRAEGLLADAVAVVPADEPAAAALAIAEGIRVVANDDPDAGLSRSLRLGLGELRTDAAVLLLGDQPLVRLETLQALAAAWRGGTAAMVRPRYAAAPGMPGHPVLVDRTLWPLAEQLEGDAGFGSLLRSGAAGVRLVEVPGDNPDVDTPADLHALKERLQ